MHHDDPLSEDIGLDITPLIDVIFMLLIFFIMTTTFSKPVLDIVLPQSESAEDPASNKGELLISVREDGTYWRQEQQLDKEAVKKLIDANPDALLNLYVDEKTPFQYFVELVDLARQRPGGRFVISTRTPS